MTASEVFNDLPALAGHLRKVLKQKHRVVLFAYNGTGKTRLSMAFKDLGRKDDEHDTLYFNAFTEDLFSWDNDLEGDSNRSLRMNTASRFFAGLQELEMESRIQHLLSRHANYGFRIDYEKGTVTFSRDVIVDGKSQTIDNIKISRGEERLFQWCFFLAVAQLVVDGEEAYGWVKYLYIDDPISSLDENNIVAVANQLADVLKSAPEGEGDPRPAIKLVVSTHHYLFFNLICNELGGKARMWFLHHDDAGFHLLGTGKVPRYHHVAVLKELVAAEQSGKIYSYHFNMLRGLLERTATFHGFTQWSDCLPRDPDDKDGAIRARLVNLLSHGNYSLYEPVELLPDNKNYFRRMLDGFMHTYHFNLDTAGDTAATGTTP